MEQDGGGDDDGVDAPLIFQCLQCRRVIGDSWSFRSSNAESKTISLSGASQLVKGDNPETSKEGPDKGSTFLTLSCGGGDCQAIVGKTYLATPRQLDHIRDMYTLYTDALCSYQLGKNEMDANIPPPTLGDGPTDQAGSAGTFGDASASSAVATATTATGGPSARGGETVDDNSGAVWVEITKIEGVILSLHERIAYLEGLGDIKLKGDPLHSPEEQASEDASQEEAGRRWQAQGGSVGSKQREEDRQDREEGRRAPRGSGRSEGGESSTKRRRQ